MNKNITLLMCVLLAIVWTAGCTCPGPSVARRPSPWWHPRRPATPGASCQTRSGEEPAPSKKLKKRVIY